MTSFLKCLCDVCRSPRQLMSLALAGLVSVNGIVMADGPVEIRSTDVSLSGEGVLTGSVLNSAAQPIAGIQIAVLHGEDRVAAATSAEDGQFVVRGLRNGSHLIQVGESIHPVRFWQTDTAPPASVEQMSIVVQEDVVRGQQQQFFQQGGNLFPWLVIGGATAIVLGTTLGDDGSSAAPASP